MHLDVGVTMILGTPITHVRLAQHCPNIKNVRVLVLLIGINPGITPNLSSLGPSTMS
jgi:hypothetical protein